MRGRFLFCGFVYPGSTHDFTIFKFIFQNVKSSGMTVWVDLGFLGIDDQVGLNELFIPFKASKNNPLDEVEKEYNRIISSIRVKVEHAMANIKAFFVLRHRNRMHSRKGRMDRVFDICAGLANFRLN